ncbi:TPA: hypothetical protein QH917_003957 [Escherichia coli]|nr:hypothetical protein [Escherichia coli]
MNIHKFIDMNEVIASNHPLAKGTTDSVTQVIVSHLNAPKAASDMSASFLNDLKSKYRVVTGRNSEAYIVRCAVLHQHFGAFWAMTTGESSLVPRVKPDGSLVLPTEHGYDWDDEFKARLEEMKLYWDAYHVFGIEDEEYFGDCVSGLDVNAVVFNGVPAIINITEGLPVSYAHSSQRFEFTNYYQRCIHACDLDAEPEDEGWMENDF